MPKTILPSKFQEWAGLDRISTVVHAMHCIWREISKDDYGLDGEIEVVVPKADGQGFQTTGGIIKVQSKAGMSYIKQDSQSAFVSPVSKGDLEDWYKSTFPVIFIVYHPADDVLYWKDVKTYVRATPSVWRSPYRIAFDKALDIFNADCYDAIRGLAQVEQPRISFAEKERLYSNLFRVKSVARLMTYAETDFDDIRLLRQSIRGHVAPACIFEGRLYTLADLRNPMCSLRAACDVQRIGELLTSEWANDEARRNNYTDLLNQLLGLHLRQLGLRYTGPPHRRNYFPRQDAESTEFKRSWFNVRTGRQARPRIVAKHYRYGADEFWRHLAANISFRQFGDAWYLQVIPRYYFTVDGEVPWDPDKVGPYTTRIKADERNRHVLNHVLFWSNVLANGHPLVELSLDGRAVVRVEREPMAGIAPFAIPYDPAVYEEPDEDTVQMDLFRVLQTEAEAADDDDDLF